MVDDWVHDHAKLLMELPERCSSVRMRCHDELLQNHRLRFHPKYSMREQMPGGEYDEVSSQREIRMNARISKKGKRSKSMNAKPKKKSHKSNQGHMNKPKSTSHKKKKGAHSMNKPKSKKGAHSMNKKSASHKKKKGAHSMNKKSASHKK